MTSDSHGPKILLDDRGSLIDIVDTDGTSLSTGSIRRDRMDLPAGEFVVETRGKDAK